MTNAPPNLPPAEWYPDPQSPGQQRWWSGSGWTEHIRPVPQPSASVPPQQDPARYTLPAPEAPQTSTRRGFLDSPFEPKGTPRNTPGNLSLAFAILPLAVAWFLPPIIGPGVAFASFIAAVVLGIVGIVRARRIGSRRATSILGLVIGSIALIGGIVVGIVALATNANISEVNVPLLESQITLGVLDQTGQVVTVDCPANPPADQGSTFTCVAKDTDGINWMIDVTIQDDQGSATWQIVE